MSTISSALMLLIFAQAPAQPVADPRVRAIAPFVETDVFAILQLDLARGDLPALLTRVLGESPLSEFAGVKGWRWPAALRQAGAREVYFVFSAIDMPGQPFAVVPLAEGADAAAIGRQFEIGGPARRLVGPATCATVHNAVVAGRPAALDRARRAPAAPRPELAAALAAAGGETTAARLLILPSPHTRRILEEMVPGFPAELGGAPITALTHGVLWAAAGLEAGPQPALRLVAESQDASAAQALVRLAHDVVEFVRRSPEVQQRMPELPRLLADLRPAVTGARIALDLDARAAAALLESASRPARQAAIFRQCVNNERQIGLAIHNYIARHDSFPPAYTRGNDGKPLLSWRVLILPYLDHDALYKEFHLDESWDSPHNRTLISRMPAAYRCPSESGELAGQGKTRYLAPRGKATIFSGAATVKLRDVTDGTVNTIMVGDAGDANAVVWTKPEDWEVDPEPRTAGVFRSHVSTAAGSNFVFADGSVRFLAERIKPAVLRALLTRNGREVVSADDF